MERSQYEISLKIRRDNHNTMEYMKKEANREGREEGREEEREEGRVKLIKSGLKKGYSLEMLADLLDLPLKEVEEFAKKHKLI